MNQDKDIEEVLQTSDKEKLSPLLFWIVAVLTFLLVGNMVGSVVAKNQLESFRDSVEETEIAATNTVEVASAARESADAALNELRVAVSAIEQANSEEPDLTNQAILDALAAIARLEVFVCGGVCPEP